MGDKARGFHSQQRRASVFGMVQPLFEIRKCASGEQVSHLARDSFRESLLQRGTDQIHHAFRSLQSHVANKTIGDDHIRFAVVNVSPFHVANKVQRKLFEQLKRLTGQFVAFTFFFSN